MKSRCLVFFTSVCLPFLTNWLNVGINFSPPDFNFCNNACDCILLKLHKKTLRLNRRKSNITIKHNTCQVILKSFSLEHSEHCFMKTGLINSQEVLKTCS